LIATQRLQRAEQTSQREDVPAPTADVDGEQRIALTEAWSVPFEAPLIAVAPTG
jgi:hypothetical protein